MKKLKMLSAALVLSIVTVQAQNNEGPKPTNDPTVYKGVTDNACALEVNFGSYSAGIDGPAMEKVQALISKYKLSSTSKNVGREGETRICLPLTEIKGSKRKRFIKELKSIAKAGELVSVSIR
jgi:hypothetical protein